MKVSKETKQYQPITIVLETKQEHEHLVRAMHYFHQSNICSDECNSFVKNLLMQIKVTYQS